MDHLTKDEKKAVRQEEWREKLEKERKSALIKTISYWLIGAVLVGLGIWALVVFSSGTSSSSTTTITPPKVTATDFQTHPGVKVTLIEYADFQCPACKSYHPILQQLEKDFGDKLNFVYRIFPLKTIHPNAINSAKAAYSASKQGKFWEMHDMLFDLQEAWATSANPEPIFVSYAKKLGLAEEVFKKDYESQEATDFANTSYDTVTTVGINSTPTFFLNGQQIDNPQSLDEFKKLIENALK